jgi:hypothetical protein
MSYYLYDFAGYYDYAQSIGVEFDEKSLKQYFDILINVPIIIFVGDVLLVCEKPTIKWNNGNIHSTNGPAIKWNDGTGFYFLNAVRFEKELFEKITSGNATAAEILAIPDIDQRTQALRFMPIKDMIAELKGEMIDETQKIAADGSVVTWKLYKFPKGETFTTDAYYCLMDCPSTGKQHFEGVEVSKTVAEAMAWAESNEFVTITPEQWSLRVPLVHEN